MTIGPRQQGPTPERTFHLVLIKPTHYDDDGYPIQWFRSAIPSNTLACLNGLAEDAAQRSVLVPGASGRVGESGEVPDHDAGAGQWRQDELIPVLLGRIR